MKSYILVYCLLISLIAQSQVKVNSATKQQQPAVNTPTKNVDTRVAKPNIILGNPNDPGAISVIKEGTLQNETFPGFKRGYSSSPMNFEVTTLKDGKIFFVSTISYRKDEWKGLGRRYTPTLQPMLVNGESFTSSGKYGYCSNYSSGAFANNNLLVAFINHKFINPDQSNRKKEFHAQFVLYDGQGKQIGTVTDLNLDFPENTDETMTVNFVVTPNDNLGHLYITFAPQFGGGGVKELGIHYFMIDYTGKILKRSVINNSYRSYPHKSIDVKVNQNGGTMLAFYNGGGNILLHEPNKKEEPTVFGFFANVPNLILENASIASLADGSYLVAYSDPYTKVAKMSIVSKEGQITKRNVELSAHTCDRVILTELKNGNIFVSMISGTVLNAMVLDGNCKVVKGFFQFANNFESSNPYYHNYDQTELINGQVLVVYTSKDLSSGGAHTINYKVLNL